MQEKYPFYKDSVKQRKVPLFTGEIRRYIVQPFCPRFVRDFGLTADQVEHDPSNVSDK